ncbi:hypothetical protein AGMMS50293_27450 [Spirochaetia bacterium]|nr:hypothetical protein AGMMS50293_27450 [Spirochaetia bacterium]
MLFAEWKDEEALDYRFNEGHNIGHAEGRTEGIGIGRNEERNMVLELIKQGYTAEQIEAKLTQTAGSN